MTTPPKPAQLLTERELQRFLEANEWTFAKTMADNPHEYIIRGKTKVGDADTFNRARDTIAALGRPMEHKGYTYTVYRHGPFRYWGMGEKWPYIINRAVENQLHDQIADQYDGLWNDPDSLAEDQAVRDRLAALHFGRGRVLDIGAGTGHAIRLLDIPATNYVGLDPSERMLLQLKLHHPSHTVVHKSLEAFQTVYEFDVVLSLFGPLNYCLPRFLTKPKQLTKQGGHYFLMTYAPGYRPTPMFANGDIPEFPTDLPLMRSIYGPPERIGQSFLAWTNVPHAAASPI